MDLSQAKLGDQYRIYIDVSGNLSNTPSMGTLLATVIAVKKPPYGNDIILGWQAEDDHPIDVRQRSSPSTENEYIPNQAWFIYGKSVKRSLTVAVKIVNGLDGFSCKKCNTFYPYALPNNKDGTLICWSCRNRW